MVQVHYTPQGVWPFVLSSYVGCVTAIRSQLLLRDYGVSLARIGLLLIAPGGEPGALKLAGHCGVNREDWPWADEMSTRREG